METMRSFHGDLVVEWRERFEQAGTELLLFNFQGSAQGSLELIIEKEQTRGYGGVAQLGEHLPCKQGVMGSNPIISTSQRKLTPWWKNQNQMSERIGL